VIPWLRAAQHLRPAHDRDPLAACRGDLRIVQLHRRGPHHEVGAIDVTRIVAQVNPGSQGLEPPCNFGGGQIGAADFEIVVEQHLGDAAHAGTADTDEVNPIETGEAPEHQAASRSETS